MRSTIPHRGLALAMLGIATLALGGCGGISLNPSDVWSNFKTSNSKPSSDTGFTVFRGAAEAPVLRAVAATDLVEADGRCAGGASENARFGLTMTECDMVALNGPPEQVNIGANERGERRVVLTYNKGDHAGIYTFVSGRLKVMEELPGATKSEPRKRAPKKPPAKKPPANRSPQVSID